MKFGKEGVLFWLKEVKSQPRSNICFISLDIWRSEVLTLISSSLDIVLSHFMVVPSPSSFCSLSLEKYGAFE